MNKYEITVNGTTYTVEVGDVTGPEIQVVVNGEARTVTVNEIQAQAAAPTVEAVKPVAKPAVKPAVKTAPVDAAGSKTVAPMPGKILSVKVKAGDQVKDGDVVCTLEAMKMEMPIGANGSGTVKAVHVAVGDNVAFNDPLVTIG